GRSMMGQARQCTCAEGQRTGRSIDRSEPCSWMAPRDELGDRREPVELGNSVGSDADAALTFKVVHGRVVMSHSTARLGNGSSLGFTELHCVNLSPENRFEASPFTREFHLWPEPRRGFLKNWQKCRVQTSHPIGVSTKAEALKPTANYRR